MRLGILATHPVQYHAPLYRALVDAGADVMVYFAHKPTPREQGEGFGVEFTWDVDLTSGYPHRFLVNRAAHASPSTFFGCDAPEIATEIASARFDAFLVSGWHSRAYWQAIRGCRRAGVPVMVRGDSQLAPDGSLASALLKRVVRRRIVSQFDACLSVGTRSEAYFREYGARRIVRAPHFVDNDFFARRTSDERCRSSHLRGSLGIGDDAMVVLFAGKLIEKKRPLDVIEAVAALPRRDVVLLFAGDGPMREACAARAAAAGVEARFLGFLNQTEMPRAYALGDVLVLPSDYGETWGLVVNEAMASGLPAIVSEAVGCQPDLVIDGETGYSFPLGDVARLSAILGIVGNDAAGLRAMGERARDLLSSFTPAAAAEGVRSAAESIARGGKS